MDFRKYLIDKYGEDTNCYPFDNNHKYVFMFVLDEISDEKLSNAMVEIIGVSKEQPTTIFDKLMAQEGIEAFSYYADGDSHHIHALINDEVLLTTLKLIDNPNKAFELLIDNK